MSEQKLIYQLSDKLKLAHKGHKALRRIAEMADGEKEDILNLVAYVASQKGPELKQVLVDVKESMYPTRRIENDAMVEREAVDLKAELSVIHDFSSELSLFSKEYITELKERAWLAESRAEQLREERARRKREQEEAIRGGALPFRDSAVG